MFGGMGAHPTNLGSSDKCVVFIVQEYFSCIVKSFSKGIKCG